MIDETKNRIGYASNRMTCYFTTPHCPADGNWQLKLVHSQAGRKKNYVFATDLMKTFVLQCVYHEHICSSDTKTDRAS